MSGQLYLLPCPISEAPALDALPASTVETARRIDHFLVEAARTARATLKAMGHPKPIAELDIVEMPIPVRRLPHGRMNWAFASYRSPAPVRFS